jgi:hypothetical protein
VTYEPPTNPSLWQVLLADEDGFITTAQEALDEFGPESHVEVSIRRLTALPVPQIPGAEDEIWELPGTYETADVAAEWRLDMVDDIGELDHIEAQLTAARAMAAGLNGAIANHGDYNRGTELAAALHDLADKLAVHTGPLPSAPPKLEIRFPGNWGIGTRDETAIAAVDKLAVALIGIPGADRHLAGATWMYQAKATSNGLTVEVETFIPAPASEDPEALKARIVELEAKLAGGAR